MSPPKPRQPSQHDRDVLRPKHEQGVPERVWDDVTGVLQGDELRSARKRRPTHERLERLEDKSDGHALLIAGMDAKLDTLVDLAGAAAAERERRSAMDATEREAKRRHIVPIIKAVGVALALIAAAIVGKIVG